MTSGLTDVGVCAYVMLDVYVHVQVWNPNLVVDTHIPVPDSCRTTERFVSPQREREKEGRDGGREKS